MLNRRNDRILTYWNRRWWWYTNKDKNAFQNRRFSSHVDFRETDLTFKLFSFSWKNRGKINMEIRSSPTYIWNIKDVLGQGATGAVYKGRHKASNYSWLFYCVFLRHRALNLLEPPFKSQYILTSSLLSSLNVNESCWEVHFFAALRFSYDRLKFRIASHSLILQLHS